jgi:hypothetical protein
VANPACLDGYRFPASLDDQPALQRIEGAIAASQLFEGEKEAAKAYQDQGHVFVEISGSMDTHTDAAGKPARMYATLRVASTGDYWLFWILAAESPKELNTLKALKITFEPKAAKTPAS